MENLIKLLGIHLDINRDAISGPWHYKENGISFVETESREFGLGEDMPIRIAEYLTAENGKYLAAFNPEITESLVQVSIKTLLYLETSSPDTLWPSHLMYRYNLRKELRRLQQLLQRQQETQ